MKLWLSPQDVGALVGDFSAQFIRNEIRAGALPARYVRPRGRQRGTWRVRRADALIYEAQLIDRALAPTSPGGISKPTLVPFNVTSDANHTNDANDE